MKLSFSVMTAAVLLSMELPAAYGFMAKQGPTATYQLPFRTCSNTAAIRSLSVRFSSSKNEETTQTAASITAQLRIPLSFEEMVNQASSAMEDAYKQGKTRQIIRVLLPRSANNDQLLQYYEGDIEDGSIETVLVPTDETWQGGIMQLYRAASYTCQAILR